MLRTLRSLRSLERLGLQGLALLGLLAAGIASSASAQTRESRFGRSNEQWCADAGHGDRSSYCEVREQTIGASGPVGIEAHNGGISVRGSDRGDALVRARIVGRADTDADARRLVSEVRVGASGSTVRAEGPDNNRDESWDVSYEVTVPRNATVTLTTHNGGIVLEEFGGSAKLNTHNGGLVLRNVAGDIHAETKNGGVRVDLTGDRWSGAGLDVQTHNGGIAIRLPEHYSAELDLQTTHGRISIDVPVTVQGTIGRSLTTTLGGGGARLHAVTTNGGVSVRTR